MLKEIKIIDNEGVKIEPDSKKKLVVIPINGKQEFVTVDVAKSLLNIIKGQLNILEAQKVVGKKGNGKHKKYITRNTGSTTGGVG